MVKACGVAIAVCLLVAVTCTAQDAAAISLADSGMLTAADAAGDICTVELNCHGPDWTYASQTEATATLENIGDGERVLTGKLPVPETEGGSVTFTERLTDRDGGLDVAYELGFSKAMTLHGLQVSVLLPADRFAGTSLTIVAWDGGEWEIRLPLAPSDDDTWQLGEYLSSAVVLGDGSGRMDVDPTKTPDLALYDLRRWDRNEFEIRMPLIYDQDGKAVTDADKMSLALTLNATGQ
ncbi:MAG TPA: hypothetical protein QGH10_04975 [Armatimonadota bacterium]|nr:hypothetical protein [Armatimonadota bacterium]